MPPAQPGNNRAMPAPSPRWPAARIACGFAGLAAGLLAGAMAAGAPPPVAVQPRVLKLPALPAGTEPPMNLPENGALKMPFVTGGAPGVAGRINDTVWGQMLDGLAPPTSPGTTFTPPADKLPLGTMSTEYTSALLPAAAPRTLTLSLTGESCGAYCEDYTTLFTFDLRDGRAISLGDLLTPAGFTAVGRRLDAERRRAYQAQVRNVRAEMKSARGRKPVDDDAADRLGLNQDCLAGVDAAPTAPAWMAGDDLRLDGRGGFALTVPRCSNHASRALDDVGRLTVAFGAAELLPSLTPYGRAIVRGEGDAPAPADPMGRELHGLLGGLAVTMKLDPVREGQEGRGWYAYDKYRTPIPLVVRRQGRSLQAFEQSESRGQLELTPAGGSLVGTWSDKERRKELPVVLQ